MTAWPNILLAKIDPGDVMNLVVVGMIVFLSVIGGIFQKAMRKAERKRAEQEAEARRRQQAGSGSTRTPPPPPQRQPQVDERLAREVRRQMGIPQVPARRPVEAKPKATVQQAAAQAIETPAETKPLRLRLAPSASPPVARTRPPAKGVAVNLLSRDNARRAIIYQEILSAPKALRKGSEMWDI